MCTPENAPSPRHNTSAIAFLSDEAGSRIALVASTGEFLFLGSNRSKRACPGNVDATPSSKSK